MLYYKLHFITYFQSSSSSVTAKSPAYKFSIENTTDWAFAEARQFRFLVITFPALENKRSLATDVAGSDVNKTFCQDQDQDQDSGSQDQDLHIFSRPRPRPRLFLSRPRPRPRLHPDHWTGYHIMVTKWTKQYTHDTHSCLWNKHSRPNVN